MKKLNHFINIIIATLFGSFVAQTIFNYIDYKRMPDIYAMRSAPWYDYYALPSFIIFGATVFISVIVKGIIFILEKRKSK